MQAVKTIAYMVLAIGISGVLLDEANKGNFGAGLQKLAGKITTGYGV